MKFDTFVSVLSATVALAAAIVSVWYSRRSLRLTNLQTRLLYFNELREWAERTCAALSAAVHSCDLHPQHWPAVDFARHRHAILCDLSALADQGRWWFPNKVPDRWGMDKERAYQGIRQAALDSVVDAYRELSALQHGEAEMNRSHREALVKFQRSFVSEIQEAVLLIDEMSEIIGNRAKRS